GVQLVVRGVDAAALPVVLGDVVVDRDTGERGVAVIVVDAATVTDVRVVARGVGADRSATDLEDAVIVVDAAPVAGAAGGRGVVGDPAVHEPFAGPVQIDPGAVRRNVLRDLRVGHVQRVFIVGIDAAAVGCRGVVRNDVVVQHCGRAGGDVAD